VKSTTWTESVKPWFITCINVVSRYGELAAASPTSSGRIGISRILGTARIANRWGPFTSGAYHGLWGEDRVCVKRARGLVGLVAAWSPSVSSVSLEPSWAGRSTSRFLFGVKPWDPLTFSVVALFLLAVAMIACAPGHPHRSGQGAPRGITCKTTRDWPSCPPVCTRARRFF